MLAVLLLVSVLTLTRGQPGTEGYCKPGQPCWPCREEFTDFKAALDGQLLQFWDDEYDEDTFVKNWDYITYPAMVVNAQNIQDIQRTVTFATRFGIRLTIKSSGHDFIGRSTGIASIMLNLEKMKRYTIYPNDPNSPTGASMRAESGLTWGRVYEAVDPYRLLAVGGSSHGVSMGGWFMGGGHSPVSRSQGLGVDTIISFRVVMVDGRIGTVTAAGLQYEGQPTVEPNSQDLWWALRGGGGGTFCVVAEFFYQLHQQPAGGYTGVNAVYHWIHPEFGLTGEQTTTFFHNFLARQATNKVGGFAFFSNFYTRIDFGEPGIFTQNGSITFALLYAGPREEAMEVLRPLLEWHPEWRSSSSIGEHPTFWDYSRNNADDLNSGAYITNRFIQPADLLSEPGNLDALTQAFKRQFDKHPLLPDEKVFSCTYITVGGKTTEPALNSSSVHPGFRSALIAMSCGKGWTFPQEKDNAVAVIKDWNTEFMPLGYGMYVNEPDGDVEDWKGEFWGPNYDRLVAIKQKYDPNRFFYCRKCVGYDLPYVPNGSNAAESDVTEVHNGNNAATSDVTEEGERGLAAAYYSKRKPIYHYGGSYPMNNIRQKK